MADQETPTLKIQFPHKGLHEFAPFNQMPPNTAIDLLNVRGIDWTTNRPRGGMRRGISKLSPANFGGPIRTITQTNRSGSLFILAPTAAATNERMQLALSDALSGPDGTFSGSNANYAAYNYVMAGGILTSRFPGGASDTDLRLFTNVLQTVALGAVQEVTVEFSITDPSGSHDSIMVFQVADAGGDVTQGFRLLINYTGGGFNLRMQTWSGTYPGTGSGTVTPTAIPGGNNGGGSTFPTPSGWCRLRVRYYPISVTGALGLNANTRMEAEIYDVAGKVIATSCSFSDTTGVTWPANAYVQIGANGWDNGSANVLSLRNLNCLTYAATAGDAALETFSGTPDLVITGDSRTFRRRYLLATGGFAKPIGGQDAILGFSVAPGSNGYTLFMVGNWGGASDTTYLYVDLYLTDLAAASRRLRLQVLPTQTSIIAYDVDGVTVLHTFAASHQDLRNAQHNLAFSYQPAAGGTWAGNLYIDGAQVAATTASFFQTTPGAAYRAMWTWGGDTAIAMQQLLFAVGSGRQLYVDTIIGIVAGASVFCGNTSTILPAINGLNQVVPAGEISATALNQAIYIADGQNYRVLDGLSRTVTTLTASAGSLPPGCLLATTFRGRLVLSRTSSDPSNIFMSAVGDPTNWDYSDETEVGAVALNASTAGNVGDVVTALVPFADDWMLIGCANTMWCMRGDPKAGGRIDIISAAVGIAQPTCWAQDPDSTIYFLAYNGLYKIGHWTPYGLRVMHPEQVSQNRLNAALSSIDFTSNKVTLQWDTVEQGLYIFVTPNDVLATPGRSFFYDARLDAFFVDRYPVGQAPTAAASLYGGGASNRFLALGGADGFLRVFDGAAYTDDGVAISSYAVLAPIKLIDSMSLGKITRARFVWADLPSFGAGYQYFMGDYEQDAAEAALATMPAPAHTTNVTAGGTQPLDLQRVRGGALALKLTGGAIGRTWALEQAELIVSPSGRIRSP